VAEGFAIGGRFEEVRLPFDIKLGRRRGDTVLNCVVELVGRSYGTNIVIGLVSE